MNQPPILYFLNQYLSGIGVGLSDIRIVEMETDVLADKFIAGLFQVIVSYDPQAIRAEREGNGTVVATSATYEGTIPEGMMMREDVLSEFPEDDLEKIFEAWIEAVQWSHAQANWGEYMKILNDVTFRSDPPYSEADLREMISAVRVHDADVLVERNKDGGGLMAYLASLKEFLAENDRLEKDFDPSAVFRNGAIVKALGQ
jgi:NitT/TauT family transport system substrate-binding protein